MIRTLAFSLLVIGTAPFAAAQQQSLPGTLNLEGIWELVELGQRLYPEIPIVQIAHSGTTVTAEFLTGSRCFDGQDRIYAFVAQLTQHPSLPPRWTLSSDDMWVCSGSPGIVQECAGRVSSKYQTSFRDASADPNLIQGTRFRETVTDCAKAREAKASSDFVLRRVTCPQQVRNLALAEQALQDLWRRLTREREAMKTAIEAAQRRGDTFNGQPTSALNFPYELIAGPWDNDMGSTESYFEDYFPPAIQSFDWAAARSMAQAMGLTTMVQQMDRIAAINPQAQQALARLESAQDELEACRGQAR